MRRKTASHTMQHNDRGLIAMDVLLRRLTPEYIHKIAIGQFQALPLIRKFVFGFQCEGQYGLQMPVTEPPGCIESARDYHNSQYQTGSGEQFLQDTFIYL